MASHGISKQLPGCRCRYSVRGGAASLAGGGEILLQRQTSVDAGVRRQLSCERHWLSARAGGVFKVRNMTSASNNALKCRLQKPLGRLLFHSSLHAEIRISQNGHGRKKVEVNKEKEENAEHYIF